LPLRTSSFLLIWVTSSSREVSLDSKLLRSYTEREGEREGGREKCQREGEGVWGDRSKGGGYLHRSGAPEVEKIIRVRRLERGDDVNFES